MINKLWALAGRVNELPARIKTLSTSLVTVLMVVAAVAQVVVEQVGDDWPQGTAVAARVAAVAAAAVLAVRRVTPVGKQDRGLI